MTRPASPLPDQVTAVLERLQQAKRPLSRDELGAAVGLSDRNLREAVRALTLAGEAISTDRETGGYILTRKAEALDAEANVLEAQGAGIYERARALRATAARLRREEQPQPGLFEEAS